MLFRSMLPERLRAGVRVRDLGRDDVVGEDEHGLALVVVGRGAVAAVEDGHALRACSLVHARAVRAVSMGPVVLLRLVPRLWLGRGRAGGDGVEVRGEGALCVCYLPDPVLLTRGDDYLTQCV